MSIDKWLDKKASKEERLKREKAFKELSEREVQNLKKKKIRDMTQKETRKSMDISKSDIFLDKIIEFRDWLNQRTYLKGDRAKIEMWIRNLYLIVNNDSDFKDKSIKYNQKREIIEKYKDIPPKFLDEKTRIALNKLIHNSPRTNSDNYYLRKLKISLKEKQKEVEYYQILDKLVKII